MDVSTGTLVAIPAYNEACPIGDVVREARQYADGVLGVDDGSKDGTAERGTDSVGGGHRARLS